MSRPRLYDHDKILTMWAEGYTGDAIAAACGVRRGQTVRDIIRRARAKGDPRALSRHRKDPYTCPRVMRLNIPAPVREALTRAAADREQTAKSLVSHLVAIVAKDNMFDAVLDDGRDA